MSLSSTWHRHLYILYKGGLWELPVKTTLPALCLTHSPAHWRPRLENTSLHMPFCFLCKFSFPIPSIPQPNQFPLPMSLSTLAEQREPGRDRQFSSQTRNSKERGQTCLLEDTQSISYKDSKPPYPTPSTSGAWLSYVQQIVNCKAQAVL